MAEESNIEDLQKKLDVLSSTLDEEKKRNDFLKADLEKAAKKRDEFKKQLESSKIDDDSKKILEQKDIEIAQMKANLDKLSAENETNKKLFEAEQQRQRDELLTAISDEKLHKTLENVTDLDTLRSLVDAYKPEKKNSGKDKPVIDFAGGVIDLATFRSLSNDEKLKFREINPNRYKELVKESMRF